MRVPDYVQNAVVFLGYRETPGDESTEKFGGTGFIVGVDFGEVLFAYLVTADHVARELENYADPIARVNGVDGRGYVKRVMRKGPFGTHDPWYRHDDRSADVALQVFIPIPYGKEFDRSDAPGIAYVPESMFVKPQDFNATGIGIGDEVFALGLFHFVRGQGSNSPIVRVGNIAMVPNERVYSGNVYGDMEALLVEARSLPRISGSPVFVRGTVDVERYSKYRSRNRRRRAGKGKALSHAFRFLGLMHGHWDIAPESINDSTPRTQPHGGVNMGIAIVTPAQKVLDVLYRPELVAQREGFVASRNESLAAQASGQEPTSEPGST